MAGRRRVPAKSIREVFCALCGESHHGIEGFMDGLTCRTCGCGRFVSEKPMIFSSHDRRFLKSLRIDPE